MYKNYLITVLLHSAYSYYKTNRAAMMKNFKNWARLPFIIGFKEISEISESLKQLETLSTNFKDLK